MNRRAGPRALAGAMGVFLALAGCSLRPKVERQGPFLSMSRQETPSPARGSVLPRSIALALGGLPPGELARLREYLAQSTDAAVRRAAPMLFDLEVAQDEPTLTLDGGATPPSASEPLRQVLPDIPALTAAANVLGGPWSAPGLSVQLGPACASGATRCVPLFQSAADPGDALLRRGRALAWGLGNAALLRVPAGSRTALLQSLRAAQTRPSTTIALVFGASRGTLDEAELDLLRDQARLALAHLAADAPLRPLLDALGTAPVSWELPIAFDADQVLVIPRLGAMARLQDFRSEVAFAER
jgi:hypothetical protein